MENPDDTRRELYLRFYNTVGRADSKGASDDAYFDEDDIIEIYDYANDINDDFIKLEALFYGARMFPGSEPLRTRRDYLYYYLGNDNAVKTLLERRSRHTTLSRLLALREATDKGLPTHVQLESILNDAKEFDDEEVIQFVTEASTAENYPWLMANVERIKAKCSYLPTLYYELAGAAEDNMDYPRAIAMAEELTMLEPFNLDYWEMMAEIQSVAGDYAGALTTLDYALAIDPGSAKSRILKGTALFHLDADPDQAIDLLKGAFDSDKFDSTAMQTLALLLTHRHRTDEAVELLRDFNRRDPSDPLTLDCLFILDERGMKGYLDTFMTTDFAGEISTNVWLDWSARHMAAGRYTVAAEILTRAAQKDALVGNESYLVEALYMAGRYDEVVAFTDNLDRDAIASPEITAATVMALVRTDRRQAALHIVDRFLSAPSSTLFNLSTDQVALTRISLRFYNAGVRTIFANIKAALMSPDTIPADDFDPFVKHV